MKNRTIINLAIGKPKPYTWDNKEENSAIGKRTVKEAELKKSGFVGDGVANPEFHGGPDRAVCIYPYEHYSKWESEFQTKLQLPAFGENLTVTGMQESEVCVGDIYKIGNTVVQVTQGRVPCSTISQFNQQRQLLNKVFKSCYTGYFLRVLEEGSIFIDSKIELVHAHPRRISVLFAARTLFHDQDKRAVEEILTVDELAADWKKKFLKLV